MKQYNVPKTYLLFSAYMHVYSRTYFQKNLFCVFLGSIEDGSVKILLDLLTDWGIGDWPILNPKWNRSVIDLEWRLAMLHVHDVKPFFSTFVGPDDRNSSVYLLHVRYMRIISFKCKFNMYDKYVTM